MSSTNINRNFYHVGKRIKSSFSLYGCSSKRTISVVTDSNSAWTTAKPFEDIPQIPILPVIGSSWVYFPIFGRYSLHKLHIADRHKRETYGDIVREKAGPLNVVSSFVPECQEVLLQHEGKYPYRGELSTIKAYRDSRKEWYKTSGVLVLKGQEWWDLRTKTQKHLMKPKAIQAFLQPMQDVAMDLVKRILAKRNSKQEVDGLLEDLYKWSLESVSYVGLDSRLGCLDPNLAPGSDGMILIKSVHTQLKCMNNLEAFNGNFPFWKYIPSPTWNKFAKACDDFTEIAFKYINRTMDDLKRRAVENRELTMMQNMMMTKDLDVSGAMVMVADMLFAGIDTTAHSVGFLLYHLSKNQNKQKILADELMQLLPNKEDRITPEIYNKLHYLKACLKESTRLHPTVRGNARTLDHDVVLCGYRIPAGTIIFCISQQIYKDEKYFENAEKFIPERWLNKDKVINPFAYAPFGIGIRSCIGRRLAELEIQCLVAEVIRNFKLEYHYADIDMNTRLVNIPDKPLRFSFLDR